MLKDISMENVCCMYSVFRQQDAAFSEWEKAQVPDLKSAEVNRAIPINFTGLWIRLQMMTVKQRLL